MLEKAKSPAAPKNGKAKVAKTTATTPTKAANRSAAGNPAVSRQARESLQERIQRRAYELWEREGHPEGRDRAHWQQAELEITRARTRMAA
jgi:hypothetical protein